MIRILTIAALVATALPPSAGAEKGAGPHVLPAGAASAPDEGATMASIPGVSPAALADLKLTAEQRNKVTDIQRELQRKQWSLIGSLRELRWKQQDSFKAAEVDVEAARRNYEEMSALRKQMFDLALEGRKRVESVLTKEQRAQLSEWTNPSQPAHRVIEPAPDRKPR